MKLSDIKVRDLVTRSIGGEIDSNLSVTAVTAHRIICGPWEFDRITGGEIDEDLGWNGIHTGSFLRRAIDMTLVPTEWKQELRKFLADGVASPEFLVFLESTPAVRKLIEADFRDDPYMNFVFGKG